MLNKRIIARALITRIGPIKAQEFMLAALAEKSGLDGFIRLAGEWLQAGEEMLADL